MEEEIVKIKNKTQIDYGARYTRVRKRDTATVLKEIVEKLKLDLDDELADVIVMVNRKGDKEEMSYSMYSEEPNTFKIVGILEAAKNYILSQRKT